MIDHPASAQCISVIVPVYNSARFLAPCLDSIRAQTHTNLDIVIVDSGSTDGSLDIIRAAMTQDERIRLIELPHSDISTSRNAGVAAAKGDWIGFSDSDDLMMPDCYESLLDAALKSNVAFSMGAYLECHQDSFPRFTRPVGAKPFTCHSAAEAQRYFLTHGKYLTHLWTKLFRRDVFQGVSFPAGRIYEDMAVIPALVENAKSLTVINKPVYRYLVHLNSLSTNINIPMQMTGLDVRRDYLTFIAEHYPDLTPLAHDAVLSIGSNVLGKLWHVGVDKYPQEWDRTIAYMCESAALCARQDLLYHLIAYNVVRHPRLLARIIHFVLVLDRML